MKKLRLSSDALVFAAAVGLFGLPNAPIGSIVPTVGGQAHAYAPCSSEYLAMHLAIQAYFAAPSWQTMLDMQCAIRDFLFCYA